MEVPAGSAPGSNVVFGLDLTACLIGTFVAVIGDDRRRVTVTQFCHALGCSWDDCPPELKIRFIDLSGGKFSPKIVTALQTLLSGGFIRLLDDARNSIIGKTETTNRVYAAALENFPEVSRNIPWIMMTARRVVALLDRLE